MLSTAAVVTVPSASVTGNYSNAAAPAYNTKLSSTIFQHGQNKDTFTKHHVVFSAIG
jgi:hypothetical protein